MSKPIIELDLRSYMPTNYILLRYLDIMDINLEKELEEFELDDIEEEELEAELEAEIEEIEEQQIDLILSLVHQIESRYQSFYI